MTGLLARAAGNVLTVGVPAAAVYAALAARAGLHPAEHRRPDRARTDWTLGAALAAAGALVLLVVTTW